MRRSPHPTALSALVLSALLTLASCGGDGDTESTGGSSSSQPTTASEAPADDARNTDQPESTPTTGSGTSSTDSPKPNEPTKPADTKPSGKSTPPPSRDTGNPDDSSPTRARQALLPAAQLPGFDQEWTWDDATTTQGPGDSPAGICMQSSLTAIGGVKEARRVYTVQGDPHASATQVSVVFPDEHTAQTSSDVLLSWRDKCATYAANEYGFKHVDMRAEPGVSTAVGAGTRWMVTYRPVPGDPDAMWFNAEGFVRDGDTLSYVVLRLAGQDYNYPPDQQPIVQALEAAAQKLQATR